MERNWDNFLKAASLQPTYQIAVGFIAAGVWLPGLLGMSTLEYYNNHDQFMKANLYLIERFPEAVWLPGFWVEFGTAAETSAFGAKVIFNEDIPPSVLPITSKRILLESTRLPNPNTDGLLALTLERYRQVENQLSAIGLGVHMVASRGPLAITAKLIGLERALALLNKRDTHLLHFLDQLAVFVISWLQAQIDQIRNPLGILILDDVLGMLAEEQFLEYGLPVMQSIFSRFEGLVRVFHNDTPCTHLLPGLSEMDFEVLNFSHKMSIKRTQELIGSKVALLGNINQREVAAQGTSQQVREAARECIRDGAGKPGLILSVSGALYPGTPAENIDAIIEAASSY